MSGNIHQKRTKKHKAPIAKKSSVVSQDTPDLAVVATVPKPVVQRPVVVDKSGAMQSVVSGRITELPRDLKKIYWFTSAVAVVLVVLWIFLS